MPIGLHRARLQQTVQAHGLAWGVGQDMARTLRRCDPLGCCNQIDRTRHRMATWASEEHHPMTQHSNNSQLDHEAFRSHVARQVTRMETYTGLVGSSNPMPSFQEFCSSLLPWVSQYHDVGTAAPQLPLHHPRNRPFGTTGPRWSVLWLKDACAAAPFLRKDQHRQ